MELLLWLLLAELDSDFSMSLEFRSAYDACFVACDRLTLAMFALMLIHPDRQISALIEAIN